MSNDLRPGEIIESPAWAETHNNMLGMFPKVTKNANNKLGVTVTPISYGTGNKKKKLMKKKTKKKRAPGLGAIPKENGNGTTTTYKLNK